MNPERLKQINNQKAADAASLARHEDTLAITAKVSDTVLSATEALIQYLEGHTTKTEVVNQLESISTPDVKYVVEALNLIDETLKTHENTDLTEVTKVMQGILDEAKKIPKDHPEQVKLDKPINYTKQLKGLADAIKAVEKVVKAQKLVAEAPVVNVPETNVNVEAPDLKPLQKGFKDVVRAVNQIVIPENKTDNKDVEKLLKESNKFLKKLLEKPVSSGGGGGSSWTAVNSSDLPAPLRVVPSTATPGIQGLAVVNPDGSNIAGGGGGGGGTQYTDGAAAVTHPVGTQPVYTDASGNVAAVSTTKPLPVASAVSDTFPATQNITTLDSGTTSTTVYNGQAFITGSPTAGSVATFALSGIQTTAIQITGTWTGSLRIEGSIDGGTTYTSKFSRLPGTVYAGAATVTANALLLAATSNYTNIRIRSMTSWTGTATIKVTESTNEHLVDVLNPVRLLDATTNSLMTINAASTAAIAANTSIVTALHPSSPLPAGTNVLGHVIVDSGSITTGGLTDTQLRATPVPVSGTFFQTTQPVSLATNTPTLQSGSTTAVTQATASNLNATIVGTGTLAVQNTASTPAGTNIIGKFGIDQTTPGTTNLVALAANQSVNNAQISGTAMSVNNGTTDAGTQRVTLSSDSTGQVKLATGANTIGALTANQSVNTAQINGVTPLMGNGVTGTGSQRVTIASDNSTISTSNATTSVVGNGAAATAQRVTIANDSTGVLATVGAVTGITNALPAGTNAIGKLAANAGVTIGAVEFTGVTTATETAVNDSATSVTILASNSARKMFTVFNTSTADLYLRLSATAATTALGGFSTIVPANGGYYECPIQPYTGAVTGIWITDPNTGGASVTEY